MRFKTRLTLLVVSLMFFNIGVLFCMNDILLPVVKEVFKFSYYEAASIQVAFYVVYIIWPYPVAKAVVKFGYRKNIILAMALCLTGCLMFLPAAFYHSFALILGAIFTLSTGISIANVVANPYVLMLSEGSKGHAMLNLVQSMSRVGYAITPVVATYAIYAGNETMPQFQRPYLFLSLIMLTTILCIIIGKIPDVRSSTSKAFSLAGMLRESRQHRVLIFGVVTMFFYLGVEACTAGFFISYATEALGSTNEAAAFLTGYYVLAAVFAVLGTFLLSQFNAGAILATFAIGMAGCIMFAMTMNNNFGVYALTLAGGFLSIMFPTIFSLSLQGLDQFQEKGSVLLNFAIVGGAAFPPLQGLIADGSGIATSYLVPLVCTIVVLAFGVYITRRSTTAKPEISIDRATS
jgi:MFS transporter, FHS family, L-fucose permease